MNTRGLSIPFTRMGRVSSEDLFEEREQGIFDFYERNAGRYRLALDIGANLGIHSILMARAGWHVTSYEPDPEHFEHLKRNLELHGCYADQVVPVNAAVHTADGYAEFVRVLDNGTANHLAGARGSFGPTERTKVPTVDCRTLFAWADFAKIDCEGSEAGILCLAQPEHACEFLVEVGSAANAERIYSHFLGKRSLWAQREDWEPVLTLADMPAHYSHGALFIGEWP